VADVKNMNNRVHKVKKKCMKFNQLCSINYDTIQHKSFFKHILQLRSLLEDKYKLLAMPFRFFSFRFDYVFINIIRLVPNHGPGFHKRY